MDPLSPTCHLALTPFRGVECSDAAGTQVAYEVSTMKKSIDPPFARIYIESTNHTCSIVVRGRAAGEPQRHDDGADVG